MMTTTEREILEAAYCYYPKHRALSVIAQDSTAKNAADFVRAVTKLKCRKLIRVVAGDVWITDDGLALIK